MAELFQTIEPVALILFIVGMVLLLIEMFIPGFGIFGILGLVCLILCIVFQAKTLTEGLLLLLIFSAIITLLGFLFGRSLKKGWLYRSTIVLKSAEAREDGYVAGNDYSRLLGRRGVSVTTLRPAGAAEFDGEKADVLTDGEFLPAGTPVEVVRVEGSRIFVKKSETK
jgi:membrane-bound serine protease (ClpP class)